MTMHPHLKRSLDAEDYHVHPEDIIEHLPQTSLGPEEQSAKRRRIERIAAQCLRGKPPVLLTASLRGPFNDGWKNPWSQAKKTKRKSSEKADGAPSAKASSRRTSITRKEESSRAMRRTRSGSRRTLESPAKVASPETSRGATYDMEDVNESHPLEDIEVPPATAPSPHEHDVTGATEFYSLDTERCVRSRSPLTNPFWLRRAESAERFNMKRSANENTHSSPTRPRSARDEASTKQPLYLAVPKAPVHVRAATTRAASPVDVRPSVSAPMAISSPVEPVSLSAKQVVLSPVRPNMTPAATTAHTNDPVPEIQAAQVRSVGFLEGVTPTTALRHPSPTQEITSQRSSQKELPVVGVQQSAEGRNVSITAAEAPTSRHSQGDQTIEHPASAPSQPKSSTGFVNKKIEATKWTIGNAPRSKPRAVNFNSSPIVKITKQTSKPSSQDIDATLQPDATDLVETPVLSQHNEQNAGSQFSNTEKEQQSLESRRSSRQSAMSTQAAMLLAQLEFQESTFPTSSSRTSRPWSQSQSQSQTPRQPMPEPSPSITPIPVFRPALEQPHHLTSVIRGPPMSTQDLFAAASPFAFSTVKKKPEAQHSHLRIAMMPFNNQGTRSLNASPLSPAASAERTPLKEQNVAPSPWSFDLGLDLQASQGSL